MVKCVCERYGKACVQEAKCVQEIYGGEECMRKKIRCVQEVYIRRSVRYTVKSVCERYDEYAFVCERYDEYAFSVCEKKTVCAEGKAQCVCVWPKMLSFSIS